MPYHYIVFFLLMVAAPQAQATSSAPSPLSAEEDFPVGEPQENEDDAAKDTPSSAKPNILPGKKDEKAVPELPELGNPDVPHNYTTMVTLQGLNKITARTSLLETRIGVPIRFGTLEILPKQCWKSSPDETPDSKALLEIWEEKPDEAKKQLFSGWMLASSPAVSALEHPVYDITVLECKNAPAALK